MMMPLRQQLQLLLLNGGASGKLLLLLVFAAGALAGALLTSAFLAGGSGGASTDVAASLARSKHERFFPAFYPTVPKRSRVVSVSSANQWAIVEERLVDRAVESGKNSKDAPPLQWTWIEMRSHINVLPILTADEAWRIFGRRIQRSASGGASKQILTRRARRMLEARNFDVSGGGVKKHAEAAEGDGEFLFPVFVQTKFGFLGDSLAVVGGLFDPAADASLKQTAARELKEELGVRCERVVSLFRATVDGNRGSGTGEHFFARGCAPVARDAHDLAEADLEAQQLLLATRADLLDALRNTRRAAAATELPLARRRVAELQALGGADADDAATRGAGFALAKERFVIKETKWIATIALTLMEALNVK